MLPPWAITAFMLLHQLTSALGSDLNSDGGSWFETCSLQSKCVKLEVTRVYSNLCRGYNCEYRACVELVFGGECRVSVEESIRGSCVKREDVCHVDNDDFNDATFVLGRNEMGDDEYFKYLSHGGRQCQTGPAGSTVYFMYWNGPHGCDRYRDLMPNETQQDIGEWRDFDLGQHVASCAPRPRYIQRCQGRELRNLGQECAWKVELPSDCECEDFDPSKCGYKPRTLPGNVYPDTPLECGTLITPWNNKRPVAMVVLHSQVEKAYTTIRTLYINFLKDSPHPFFLYSDKQDVLDLLKEKLLESSWLPERWWCMFFYFVVRISATFPCAGGDIESNKEIAFWFKDWQHQRLLWKAMVVMRVKAGVVFKDKIKEDPFELFDSQGYKYGYPREYSRECPSSITKMTQCLQRQAGFENFDASEVPCECYTLEHEIFAVGMLRRSRVRAFIHDMFNSGALGDWGYGCIRQLMTYLFLENAETKEYPCSGPAYCMLPLCPMLGGCAPP